MINVNNTKAVEITKEAIRAHRQPLLEALDVDFNRAMETGADTSQIVADKQVLRDMTNDADGKSVDELKAIVDGLGV